MGVSEGSKLTGTKILGRGLRVRSPHGAVLRVFAFSGLYPSLFNYRILLLSCRADPGHVRGRAGRADCMIRCACHEVSHRAYMCYL